MESREITGNIRWMGMLCLSLLLGLFGCTSVTTDWRSRDGGAIRGIVNDSLALVESWRCYTTTTEEGMSVVYEDGCANPGLHLVNYRAKETVLWGDTVGYSVGTASQLTDSILIYFGGTVPYLWKVGQKPMKLAPWNETGSCSYYITPSRIRPWSDGKLLVLADYIPDVASACQYGLWDTATGELAMAHFSSEDAWMADCEDISYFDGEAVCLRKSTTATCGIDMVVNNEVVDSLRMDSCKFLNEHVASWMGSYIRIETYRNYNNWAYGFDVVEKKQLSSDKFDEGFSGFFIDTYVFADSSGNEISYTGSDLLVTTGGN